MGWPTGNTSTLSPVAVSFRAVSYRDPLFLRRFQYHDFLHLGCV